MFKITRQICARRGRAQTPICDKDGILLTADKDPPDDLADFQDAAEDLDISTDPPTKQQVLQAIKSLKNGEATGLTCLMLSSLKVTLS